MKSKNYGTTFRSSNGKFFNGTPEELRVEVHKEINQRKLEPVVIERSSRDEIKAAKKAWKKNPVRDNEVVSQLTIGSASTYASMLCNRDLWGGDNTSPLEKITKKMLNISIYSILMLIFVLYLIVNAI